MSYPKKQVMSPKGLEETKRPTQFEMKSILVYYSGASTRNHRPLGKGTLVENVISQWHHFQTTRRPLTTYVASAER
eukprot:4092241-Amphidinium_carterae.1